MVEAGESLVGAVNVSRAFDLLIGPRVRLGRGEPAGAAWWAYSGRSQEGLAVGNWAAFAIGVSGLLLLRMFLLQF